MNCPWPYGPESSKPRRVRLSCLLQESLELLGGLVRDTGGRFRGHEIAKLLLQGRADVGVLQQVPHHQFAAASFWISLAQQLQPISDLRIDIRLSKHRVFLPAENTQLRVLLTCFDGTRGQFSLP